MSKMRPFRFGVITEGAPSREQWVARVRKAEDLGYATFLLADHFVNEFPPLVALAVAADATKTLRVGAGRCSSGGCVKRIGPYRGS